MKDKAIVQEMAELEGRTVYLDTWEQDGKWWTACDGHIGRLPIPAYLTSHDAVQRLVDGLSDFDCSNVFNALYQMYNHEPSIVERSRLVLKSTPRQKCEAILKAKGLWEESE